MLGITYKNAWEFPMLGMFSWLRSRCHATAQQHAATLDSADSERAGEIIPLLTARPHQHSRRGHNRVSWQHNAHQFVSLVGVVLLACAIFLTVAGEVRPGRYRECCCWFQTHSTTHPNKWHILTRLHHTTYKILAISLHYVVYCEYQFVEVLNDD